MIKAIAKMAKTIVPKENQVDFLYSEKVPNFPDKLCISHSRSLSVRYVVSIGGFIKLATNGLALGEEAYFEGLNYLPVLTLIRSIKLHLSTEPAFLPSACYKPFFLSFG